MRRGIWLAPLGALLVFVALAEVDESDSAAALARLDEMIAAAED